jgi:hypothetical protein
MSAASVKWTVVGLTMIESMTSENGVGDERMREATIVMTTLSILDESTMTMADHASTAQSTKNTLLRVSLLVLLPLRLSATIASVRVAPQAVALVKSLAMVPWAGLAPKHLHAGMIASVHDLEEPEMYTVAAVEAMNVRSPKQRQLRVLLRWLASALSHMLLAKRIQTRTTKMVVVVGRDDVDLL